jgi:tetratricopeptide (TPR) repeat protein
MSATGRVSFVTTNLMATAVLLFSMAGAMAMLHTIDQQPRNSVAQQALYLSSPKLLRRMSLGYTGLLADIYWTRSVQYFGEQHHNDSGDFRLLAPLLEVTTELDPKLLPAYQFGANFLAPKPPSGAGLPGAALSLIKYGIEHNPDQWRLYYNLGFLYYTEFKDYAKAADAFERGAKLPNANEFMPILAARMAQHAGDFDTARMLWFTTYQSSKQEPIRQNAVEHLLALQVDEDVTRLEQMVKKYQEQTRQLPASMDDLERAGFIHGTPADPKGHSYKLMADGRIEVQNPKSIFFITKGMPPGMETPQPPRPPQPDSKLDLK